MRARPSPDAFVQNPPWVAEIIGRVYEDLEDSMPSRWLPRLMDVRPVARGSRVVAAVKEYGCGAYGCVIPTLDPAVVLKITTDHTEAEFAATLANQLVAPICVHYHVVKDTGEFHDNRRVYLLWRDSAERVGGMSELPEDARDLMERQHLAAQNAFREVQKHSRLMGPLLAKWLRACHTMAQQTDFPELQPIGQGLVQIWEEQHIFFGDLHEGNFGMVGGRWVITDPGHIAVIDPSAIPTAPQEDDEAHDPDGLQARGILFQARPIGRPSQQMMEVRGAKLPVTTLRREDAVTVADSMLPPMFRISTIHIRTNAFYQVVSEIPENVAMVMPDTVYVFSVDDLVAHYEVHGEVWDIDRDDVRRVLEAGQRIPSLQIEIADGLAFLSRSFEAAVLLQAASTRDRRVAATFATALEPPAWRASMRP